MPLERLCAVDANRGVDYSTLAIVACTVRYQRTVKEWKGPEKKCDSVNFRWPTLR